MLFTRCPACQTTFRITADTLQLANGAVRCGHCAAVFSAYSGLRQEVLDDGVRPGDETLSPTLQTRELAGIEDIDGPALGSEGGAAPVADETSPRGDEREPCDLDDEGVAAAVDDGEDRAGDVPSEERLAPLAAGEPSDTVAEPQATAATAVAERTPDSGAPNAAEGPTEETAPAEAEALPFDAPVDEWEQLLGDLETADAGEPGADADAGRPEPCEAAEPIAAREPDAEQDAEPALRWTEAEAATALAPGTGASGEARPVSADAERNAAGRGEDDAPIDIAISAEEIDATLSAEPDPDIIAALEAGLGQSSQRSRRSRWWGAGSAGLLVLLGLQLAHHFRAPLAARPVIGPLLQSSYGALGIELTPDWDLGQYEITDWAATAGPSGSGTGSLHITAQIRNAGPKAQPYPSVRLELKDRWEAVIGSRIFEPTEYNAASGARGLLPAGATVPADLEVVDPGLDASGFELDVCLTTETGRTRCASDRVFEE